MPSPVPYPAAPRPLKGRRSYDIVQHVLSSLKPLLNSPLCLKALPLERLSFPREQSFVPPSSEIPRPSRPLACPVTHHRDRVSVSELWYAPMSFTQAHNPLLTHGNTLRNTQPHRNAPRLSPMGCPQAPTPQQGNICEFTSPQAHLRARAHSIRPSTRRRVALRIARLQR